MIVQQISEVNLDKQINCSIDIDMTMACGIFASLKLCTEENKAFEKYLRI